MGGLSPLNISALFPNLFCCAVALPSQQNSSLFSLLAFSYRLFLAAAG
jgi:hypothetical protein